MNRLRFVAQVLVAAAVGTGGGCLRAERSEGQPSQPERFPLEQGVKLLDHQRAPLPEVAPIRFTKVFTLEAQWPYGPALMFLAFSPDGKTLAASRAEGGKPHDVTLWDVQKRKLLRVLPHTENREHRIGAIAFVPPGDRLVSGCWNLNKVFLWDVRTGKLLDTLDTGGKPNYWITGLAAFPDGKRVLSCAGSGLIVWDLEAKTNKTLPLEEHVPAGDYRAPAYPRCCHSVAFAADGSRFATSVNDALYAPRILVWDAKTCRVTRVIPMKGGNRHFAYAPDGTTVAADYYDPDLPPSNDPSLTRNVVGVWDAASGKKLLAGRPYDSAICDLAYTRDGKYLLIAGTHRDVLDAGGQVLIGVWDVATGKVVNEVGPVNSALGVIPGCMAISPDNNLLAVPGRNIDIYAIEYTGQSKPRPEPPAVAKP